MTLPQEMSLRADASESGGVVVEYESEDVREPSIKRSRSQPGKQPPGAERSSLAFRSAVRDDDTLI